MPALVAQQSERDRSFKTLSQVKIINASLRKQHIKQTSSKQNSENTLYHEYQSAVSNKCVYKW